MHANRRTVLAALLAAAAVRSAGAASREVLRVNGEVTAKNFAGLAQFLNNAADTVIGLRVSFPGAGRDSGAALVAEVAADGLFTSYLSGSAGDTAINAREGVNFQNGMQVVNGFFIPKYAGMNQGITSIFLEKQEDSTVLLSDAAVREIDIDRLDPSIRKEG